jgi:precorrin-2 dehydrogenase/sirohydrochlorin ferrochelatase
MADRLPQYPVNLNVAAWPCLVVGGGTVAAGKVAELLLCGAHIDVVAPDVAPEIEASAAVTIHRRAYRAGEAADYRLVITATDSSQVNRQVFDDADGAGVLVNAADDPANCAFTLPARTREGDLLITVSTAGRSPAFSSWMRRQIEAEIGSEHAELLEMVADAREDFASSGEKMDASGWQMALDSGMLELIRKGRTSEAKERLRACLSSQSD